MFKEQIKKLEKAKASVKDEALKEQIQKKIEALKGRVVEK